MGGTADILDHLAAIKARGEPFALATVVRTVAATAAKAGAKAVILPDGTISEGWIGGGCARAAVLKAAREALADGKPRLVSVQPPEVLQDQGIAAGDEHAGVRFANNMCPSRGTMDVFVEPVLPRPQIIICGASPVAVAVAELGRKLGYAVTVCAPASEQPAFAEAERRIEGFALPVEDAGSRFVVVSTQGRGDEAALSAALAVKADYVAFVGSRRKAEALKAALAKTGIDSERLESLRAPAGLDLGAITPDEIAVSILAEIIAARRSRHARSAGLGQSNRPDGDREACPPRNAPDKAASSTKS
jgi:xanthine dehydrogenase accessory factor